MKQKNLLKTILLLCVLIAGSGSLWAEETTVTWTASSGALGNGIGSGTISTGTFSWNYTRTLISGSSYTGWSSSCIQLGKNGGVENLTLSTSEFEGYIIKSVSVECASYQGAHKVAISVGGTSYLSATATSSWTTVGTSTGTGTSQGQIIISFTDGSRALYIKSITVKYEQAANVTSLTVGTAPTKLNYKVGEALDLTGLVLDADGTDVTSGYTASPVNGATLSEVGEQTVTFTYGGKSCSQIIHVGSLQSIEINTPPTKTTYNEGDLDTFDPTGMVVKATFSDGEDTPTEWQETIEDYTYSPTTALHPSNTNVTVSYTWGNVTKTAEQAITVNAGPKYTVSFNAEGGSCSSEPLTETEYQGGVTLPAATISVNGWEFAGWAVSTVTNTTTKPTLYAAGSTYYPTANITLYAVYKLDGIDDSKYKRATRVDEITSASSIVIVNNKDSYVLDHSRTTQNAAPTETEGLISPNANTIFTLSGNNTNGFTLTGANGTLGVATLPTSSGNKATSWTTTNNNWIVGESSYAENTFYLKNAASTYVCLEYYSGWVAYYATGYANNQYIALKLYVPVQTAYNSNPNDINQATVAFNQGGTTLYLDGTNTYTNAATVTGSTNTVTYTSSDEDVATVDASGVVTAVGIGSATITASVEAELGVSSAASATYDVVVKSTTTIAGIKGVNSTSTATAFTADLTDANITYVSGTHAYLQDASAAIYVSCATNDWVEGKKFSGAVSGKVKKSYGVWEITEFTGTPVEGGTVPAALTDVAISDITSETYASYEGKKITLTGVTVSAAMASSATSGGEVSDGTNTIKIGAPAKDITLVKDEQGSITGFVAQYNGTYRLNLYEQSQFVKTHNAPTAQTLSFDENVFNIDEDTNDFTNFTPQSVSGAQGSVTYDIANTSGDVIYENFNTADGTFTLKTQAYGTATITATAAAIDVTEGGVTTPYTETMKSYTVTVYPRYTSTFSIDGDITEVRQDTHGASITIPTPAATIGDYSFVGWKEASAIDTPTDEAPTMVTPPTTPTSNVTYYAVYAIGTVSSVEQDKTSTLTIKQTSSPGSPYTNNGVTWTFSGLTFASSNNCGMPNGASVTFTLPDSKVKTKSVQAVKTQDWSTSNISIALTDASSTSISTFNNAFTYNFTESNNSSSAYTLTATNQSSKTAWISSIVVTYTDMVDATTYSGYRTTIPSGTITLNAACTDGSLYYGTYSNSSAFIVPSDLVVSEIGIVDGKLYVEDYSTGDVVPANTGVMVSSDESGDHTVLLSSATGTSKLGTDNCLRPTGDGITASEMANADANCLYYRLTMHNGNTIGFYWGAAEGATFAVAANKAYLAVPTSQGGARMGLWFGDDKTGIADVNLNFSDNLNGVYDLQGRRVDNPKKGGLYIVNGKKQIMK